MLTKGMVEIKGNKLILSGVWTREVPLRERRKLLEHVAKTLTLLETASALDSSCAILDDWGQTIVEQLTSRLSRNNELRVQVPA